jgi:hypothetical protein
MTVYQHSVISVECLRQDVKQFSLNLYLSFSISELNAKKRNLFCHEASFTSVHKIFALRTMKQLIAESC